jgi:hypothetical protein
LSLTTSQPIRIVLQCRQTLNQPRTPSMKNKLRIDYRFPPVFPPHQLPDDVAGADREHVLTALNFIRAVKTQNDDKLTRLQSFRQWITNDLIRHANF